MQRKQLKPDHLVEVSEVLLGGRTFMDTYPGGMDAARTEMRRLNAERWSKKKKSKAPIMSEVLNPEEGAALAEEERRPGARREDDDDAMDLDKAA